MAYTEFGIKVRTELLKRGVTVSQLAEEIGVSQPHLSQMLQGEKSIEPHKYKIIRYLGMEE